MPLVEDLLSQAEELAKRGLGRPRQADLRRAVSTAYYATFHATTDKIARTVLTLEEAASELGLRLRRSISHASLLRASKWVESSAPPPIAALYTVARDDQPPSTILRQFCLVAIRLQEARHRADYDLASAFSRFDTMRLVGDARQALGSLASMESSSELRVFAWTCLLGDSIARNA